MLGVPLYSQLIYFQSSLKNLWSPTLLSMLN